MQRRNFIALLGGAAIWPLPARAQQNRTGARIPKVGVLWHAANADEEKEYLAVLTGAFRDLGYAEGQNVEFLHRYPAEQLDQFRVFARDLVESNVDVVVAVTGRGAMELKEATSTIPIVFVIVPDPVGLRLVESLAHPGGNATGLSLMTIDLSGKRLALLKDAVPKLSRVAFLAEPKDLVAAATIAASMNAARTLGLSVHPVEVPTPGAVETVFSAIAQDGFDGAIVTGSMMFNERAQVGASALAHKMPTLTYIGEMVPYGLLMSYGPDFPDYFRKAAGYVDKILKGAKPADLPIEQPTRFKLVINLKTANALGLTVPLPLLAQADDVIE